MITQAIKRWLDRLFAWWPWGKSFTADYAQVASSGNTGTTQEPIWRTTVEGVAPQPGITSVAVEHGNEEAPPEGSRTPSEDHAESIAQPHQPVTEENTKTPHIALPHGGQGTNSSQASLATPPPTVEQHLAFMRYLVQRGLVNEGFDEGQIPDQYRHKE